MKRLSRAQQFLLALLSAMAVVCIVCGISFAQTPDGKEDPGATAGQEQRTQSPQSSRNFDPQSIYFYAFLEPASKLPLPPAVQFFSDKPITGEFIKSLSQDKMYRPMAQFYYWAAEKKPFGKALLFCLLFSVLINHFIPGWMSRARDVARRQFWRSLLVGIIFCVIAVLAARSVFLTEIGWPLGIALMAGLQLSLLAGIVVSITIVGQTICYYTRLSAIPYFARTADRLRLLEYTLGSLVIATILQVPGLGGSPHLGTRIAALLALLGLGALYLTRKSSDTPSR